MEEYSICYFQLQSCRPILFLASYLSQYFIETHISGALENTHTHIHTLYIEDHYTDLIRAQREREQSAAENADLNSTRSQRSLPFDYPPSFPSFRYILLPIVSIFLLSPSHLRGRYSKRLTSRQLLNYI